jgi:hypothetical protein
MLATAGAASWYLLSQASEGPWALVGLPLDDNWIHLVYARSFAEHGWFFYNPGVPEAGMSSPLWAVLLGIVYKVLTPLGVSPQWCAKALSLVLAAGLPLITYNVCRTLGLNRNWAWIAGLLVAIEPNLGFGSVSGMEAGLFAFLSLLAVWLAVRGRHAATGIVLGLLVVTRGEGVLTAAAIAAIPLVRTYATREKVTLVTKKELVLALQLLLPAAVLGGLWALYNHSVSGHWLPNTFYVKHNFSLGWLNLGNLRNILVGYFGHLAYFRGYLWPATVGLILVGLYGLAWKARSAWAALVVLIPVLQVYAFSLNIKMTALATPWTYYARRYLDHLIPFLIVAIVAGVAFLWDTTARTRNRLAILILPLALLGVMSVGAANVANVGSYLVEQYSWNTENIERVDVAMGKWVAGNLPPDATVAVADAGAVRFWCLPTQEVIDLIGLNYHECVGRPFAELMNELEPEYLVLFRSELFDRKLYEELHTLRPAWNSNVLGGDELVALAVIALPAWSPK